MLLEVGRVVKPHGLRGEVIVELTTNRSERMVAGACFVTPKGDLRVSRASTHLGRWIVTFEDISTRQDADALRNLQLLAEPIDDPDVLWIHRLIGSEVVDTAGRVLGVVETVEANLASDLLVLESGALIPATFVIEQQQGKVVVDPPEGLLE